MWTLILFAHVGMACSGNSNALDHVPGFESQDSCIRAGNITKQLASGTCKEIKFTCVETPKGSK